VGAEWLQNLHWAWWYMPVIPALERWRQEDQPGLHSETLTQKSFLSGEGPGFKLQYWAGGVAQAVEHLPSKCKVLHSNPSNTKNNQKSLKFIPSSWNQSRCLAELTTPTFIPMPHSVSAKPNELCSSPVPDCSLRQECPSSSLQTEIVPSLKSSSNATSFLKLYLSTY
jgi:hypothetical protein